MQDFEGFWVPLVTPFAEGAVDHDGLRRLATHLRAQGVDGFVVCGSTGEASTLDDAERLAVLRTVLAAVPDRPVVMGLSGVRPAEVAARAARYGELPVAGFLVAPPAYVRPSQSGIADFFTTVADASPRPLVLYDIPARVGVRIETATMRALADHPRIRAVKDCGADPEHTQAIIDDGRLQVLGGDDHRMFTSLCQGAAGSIAASGHVRPALFVALHRLVREGDLRGARTLWRALWPLTTVLFSEPNPALFKAALAHDLGSSDEVRAPMTRASAAGIARMDAVLAAVDASWPPAGAPSGSSATREGMVAVGASASRLNGRRLSST